MVDAQSREYLKRPSAVARLAESRAVRQGKLVVTAAILVASIGLAIAGAGKSVVGPFAEVVGSFLLILAPIEFLNLCFVLFRRAARRNREGHRANWDTLLMAAVSFWLWAGLERDMFVESTDSRPLIALAIGATTAMTVMFALLGVVYLTGFLFRPAEKKEIN